MVVDQKLVDMDWIDGENHDTNAGIKEGDTAQINESVTFVLTEGGLGFRAWQKRVSEITGKDHLFDDNPKLFEVSGGYDELALGDGSVTLDDANKCKIEINYNIQHIQH